MTKNHKHLLILYGFNQAVHYFALGIIIPVMILTLMDLGFNIGRVGIAMAAMSTTVMVLELPTGGFADTIGRKRVYLIALSFYILGYAFILITGVFWQLIAAVILIGTGRALSSGTIDAWFIDEHKRLGGSDDHLQADLARVGIITPAALGAGTLLGGFLPDISGGFTLNIVLIICVYALQMVLTGILIREDRDEFTGRLGDGFRTFPAVLASAVSYGLTRRNTLVILAATAALGIGLSGLEQLWQPRIRAIAPDTGTWVLGVVATGYFLAAAAGSGVSPGLLRGFGRRYRMLLFVFRFLMAALYILLSTAGSLAGFIPLYFTLFFFHGITGSPEMTVFNRDIPSKKRSSLLSLNSLFLQAGGAAGSVIAGQLALRGSVPSAWVFAGSILLASAFAYLLIREKNVEPDENRVQ